MLADRFGMTEPTAWTVRLREGVRYSDGRLSRAGNSLRSLRRMHGRAADASR